MTGWPKSNAESKHIYCSLISIHYQLNIPHETTLSCNLLPKFPVKKFLMTHIYLMTYSFTMTQDSEKLVW